MGSKKHKKESKKKKHRSRSRSPLEGEERERKRHRKHKDRKKDRSPDVEEVPVDSHLEPAQTEGSPSRSRSSSAERDRRARRERVRDEPGTSSSTLLSREVSGERDESPGAGGAGAGSLSVDDTNRLRAKLGLKPLQVHEKPEEDGKFKDDLGEFYHKPAGNLAAQRRADKLRERLDERRERRALEHKLQTKLLTEGSDDEDASAWVTKSRDLEKQKKDAAKRAAMLDEMDAVFGVSALVEEEERSERAGAYGAAALSGLRVAHDLNSLADERDTVLTLADAHVLADAEDVLVNLRMVDDERYRKNIDNRKKAKAGYQAYDEEAELEASLGFEKPVLAKYDEEIDRDAADKRRGFVLGDHAGIEAQRFRDMMRQERLRGGPDKRLESLRLPELQLASDYLSAAELSAKFKKPKRRSKGIRKKAKEEPIDVDDYEAGAAPLDTDDTEVKMDQLRSLVQDEEETEPDSELQTALARARRLRQHDARACRAPRVEDLLDRVKEEPSVASAEEGDGTMVLDACAEFCRTLGDIPTYGQAGNRDSAQEIIDYEREETEPEAGPGGASGAWLSVDVGSEGAAEPGAGAGALVAEPALGAGVAGALQLALSKGYLERAGAAPAPRAALAHLLAARHYSIEDKTLGDDDKHHGRRERGGGGPLTEFREKAAFRPRIKLEYADDDGRPLRPKEAFRYLSHKFHGKGPGKNKQEKRIKKQLQEGLMKKMSSTDTPLGTLQMLQDKQKETRSPYVLLSGAKREPPR